MNPNDFLSEQDARRIYDDAQLMDSLEDDEVRLVLQSIYFYDIELFAHDVCERWTRDQITGKTIPSAPFHREMWAQCRLKHDSLFIVSRDHAKTTTISKIQTLHELIYGIEKGVLLISSKGLGESVVGDIRKELETNEKLRWIYGSLIPIDNRTDYKSQKWRQRELQLLNGTSLKTLTKGEAVRGLRPTKIRVDDPQEKKDVKNPIVANEFWNWFWTSVYPTLDDNGSVDVLATIISSNCFANQLKQEARERSFKLIEYPAILDFDEKAWTGTPLWPEKWSMEALKKRYHKIGRREFLQEYQNQPFIVNGSPVFGEDNHYKILQPLREFKGFTLFRELFEEKEGKQELLHSAFLGIDIANGGINGDYTAVSIRNEKFELLAQYRGHIAQDRLAHLVNEIVPFFKDVFIVPENNIGLAFINECKNFDWFMKIYRQQKLDQITQKQSDVVGFNTNAKTKILIISELEKQFRVGDFEVSSQEKEEIDHYYYDEKGGMNAISPYHDDLIIADALCIQGIKQGIPGDLLVVL